MSASRARTLAIEVLLLLAYPIVLSAWVGSVIVVGPAAFSAAIVAALVAWPFVCLPGFASRDLVGFASLALPSLGLATVGLWVLARGGDPAPFLLGGAAWVVVWTLGGRRIWPWWSRVALHRHRIGSPEAGLLRAWRQITPRWRAIRSATDAAAVQSHLLALEEFETDRTRPVITGILALWRLAQTPTTTRAAFERANARLNDEWDRLLERPGIRIRGLASPQDHVWDRPTRATRLEYVYPAVEALLAVATESQLGTIVTASVRGAERAAGGTVYGIEPAPAVNPVAAANAVFDAIQSNGSGSGETQYIELIREIVGPEAAARARPIPTSSPRSGNADTASDTIPSVIGTAAASAGGLTGLILIAATAGVLGTIIQDVVWQWVARLPSATTIDGLLGVVLVAVLAHAIVRVWLGRPTFLDVVAIYVASGLSSMLMRPLVDALGLVAAPVLGENWTTAIADSSSVAPLAPLRAVTFAVTLLVFALLLRPGSNEAIESATAASISP